MKKTFEEAQPLIVKSLQARYRMKEKEPSAAGRDDAAAVPALGPCCADNRLTRLSVPKTLSHVPQGSGREPRRG